MLMTFSIDASLTEDLKHLFGCCEAERYPAHICSSLQLCHPDTLRALTRIFTFIFNLSWSQAIITSCLEAANIILIQKRQLQPSLVSSALMP